MSNRFLKIVVAFATTLSLLFTFLNVNASTINDNPTSYFKNYSFKEYHSILEPNDLKGTIWQLNYDSYYDIEYSNIDTFYGLRLNGGQEDNVFLNPFIIQERNYLIGERFGYYFMPNAKLNLVPLEFSDNSLVYSIVLNAADDTQATLNFNGYRYFNDNGLARIDYSESYSTAAYFMLYENHNYYNSFLDISYINDIYDLNYSLVGMSNIYIYFPPSSNYYITTFSTDNNIDVLERFKRFNTQVTISSLDKSTSSILQTEAWDIGWNDGWQAGYAYAEETIGTDGYQFPILSSVLNSVNSLLQFEIFPNVRLSYFIFVPLTLGIVGMIFYFWRKD